LWYSGNDNELFTTTKVTKKKYNRLIRYLRNLSQKKPLQNEMVYEFKLSLYYTKSIFLDFKINKNPMMINGILSHCPVENNPRSLSKPP
jgi:hypothetical protein